MTRTEDLAKFYSVQDLPGYGEGIGAWFEVAGLRHSMLSPFGTQQREQDLRNLDRNDYQLAWSGAVAGLLNRWSATPWEIKGESESVQHYQSVLRNAHFGAGWSTFVKMLMRDYLRQDRGGFIELIGAGEPDEEIVGPVVSIAYLDSLRCYPTGDPDYPVMYLSRKGSVHQMHKSRIVQLLDMPDGDDLHPGYGRCALSRAITVVERELLLNKYVGTYLDDKPAPGLNIFKGITETQFREAYKRFLERQRTDTSAAFGEQINFFTMGDGDIDIQTLAFTQAPEKFDFEKYVVIGINQLALALGVDKLDLWEITSSGLGSGMQAEIMASKSKGRTFGDALKQIERIINVILPDDCQFAFTPRDAEEDASAAANASAWAGAVSVIGNRISSPEARQLLANQVPAVYDALTDAAGHVERMDDVRDQTMPDEQVAASTPPSMPTQDEPIMEGAKAYSDTRDAFTRDFVDLVKSVGKGETARRRFGLVLRAQLNRMGRAAYVDGLREGGVEGELDDEDRGAIADWLAQQSAFVTKFANEVYSRPFSESEIGYRAELWANKSLETMRLAGLASADRNGLYEWRIGQTEEHCLTCLALNGQRHRLKEYVKRNLLPKSSALGCKGYNCDCTLTKVQGRASGRFPVVKAHSVAAHLCVAPLPASDAWDRLRGRTKAVMRIVKGIDGRRLMLIVTSNAYEDRDGEIVSRKALQGYVDECWQDDTYVGDNTHLFWHDGDPIGDIVYADMKGKFLVEISRERPDALIDLGGGRQARISALWDALEATQGDIPYGASHGFAHRVSQKNGSVYSEIYKYETSTMPLEYVANAYTFSGVIT
jgi:hypothetical protein